MAQQPRQKRIGIYGKFTAPSLDTSASDKMRALAGLGETVGKIAMDVARPAAADKGAKEGAIAAKEAERNPVTGEVIETPTRSTFGFSGASFNAAAQQKVNQLDAAAVSSYKAGLMEDINVGLFDIATQNPSNIKEYSKLSEGLYDGLKGSVPLEMQESIRKYFGTVNRQQGASVLKAQQKIELDQ